MTEVSKLLYILVEEDEEGIKGNEEDEESSFRYTRPVLQSTLQLMGCKDRHAFKISQRVFEILRKKCLDDSLVDIGVIQWGKDFLKVHPVKVNNGDTDNRSDKLNGSDDVASEKDGTQKGKPYESYKKGTTIVIKRRRFIDVVYTDNRSDKLNGSDDVASEKDGTQKSKPYESYKKRTTIVIKRRRFIDVVCDALSEYKYVGPNQRADFILACRIRERKESVTVLLCGTSGCGKSTLSALLASRLGITTVISTDSIRHMMRSFVDEKQNPLLWSSTYHAGEHLDPVAVSEAKAKKKAKKEVNGAYEASKTESPPKEGSSLATVDLISPKQMAIEGFKAQSEMVIDSLDRLFTAWEERKESVVVEGVHLSLNFVMWLMKKHPSIIPFMIYITNEDKHMERFAVRAKYMTLDPAKNKYVKYIRTIQEYLCNRADKHLVPKINNTNVDKSVAAIHATVFSCLRRREAGEKLYDSSTNTVFVIDEEYRNQREANSLGSKGMLQLIQRQGSSRHLMALLNNDGSVAKAWSAEDGLGIPMNGPLQIGRSESVNLQFGNFGISAWLTDLGCTNHTSRVDDLRGELTDNGSKYYSSCCSSPKVSEGHAKEMEGSVDEESTKSDEYDDLAMQDILENAYFTDAELEYNQDTSTNTRADKYKQNLERFLRTKREPVTDSREAILENGYFTDEELEYNQDTSTNTRADKYKQNLERFLRTKREPVTDSREAILENGYFTDEELEYNQDTSTNTRADKYKQNLERFLRTKREPVTDSWEAIESEDGHSIPEEKRLPSSGSLRVRGRSESVNLQFGNFGLGIPMNGPLQIGRSESVDEESTKSDEEYDDLAMQDILENGYFTDAELEYKQDTSTNTRADKYKQNLERFLRTKREPVTDSLVVNSGRVRGRSYSISGAKKE